MFTAKEQLLEKRNGPDEWRTSERFASQHQHPNLKNTNKTHSPNSCFHVPWAGLLLVGCLLIPVVSPVSTLRRASAWPPGTWCIGGLCHAFPDLQDADGPESRHTSGSLRVTSPPPCRIRSCSPDTGLGAELLRGCRHGGATEGPRGCQCPPSASLPPALCPPQVAGHWWNNAQTALLPQVCPLRKGKKGRRAGAA